MQLARRALAATLAAVFLLPAAALAAEPAPPQVTARSAALMDVHSGRLLFAQNPTERILPASLAKIMTFEVALEALDAHQVSLDTKVPISKAAWQLSVDQAVSHMFLQVGSQVPFEDLLYGLMVSSGNDAAEAIAEQLGGTPDTFVQRMNAKAAELGLANTHYVDPHGLATKGTYTTAEDVAKLVRYVWQRHPDATKYTSPREFTWNNIRQPNWNELISGTNGVTPDPRVVGFKTGSLEESGYHLAASAVSGDQQLIAVVMGTAGPRSRAVEADKLLQWGFTNWASQQVDWQKAAPGQLSVYEGAARAVSLAPPGPIWVAIPKDEASMVHATASVDWPVVAPVGKGQSLGQVTVTAGGQEIARVPLQAQSAVKKGGLFHVAWDALRLFLTRLWRGIRHR